MLKRVISNLVLQREEVIILDMEAGLEHLGRGTADFVDRFIVVVETGARSIQTYHNVVKLASDLGVKKVSVAGSKVKNSEDEEFIKNRVLQDALLGVIRWSEDILAADRKGVSPFDEGGSVIEDVKKIKSELDKEVTKQ